MSDTAQLFLAMPDLPTAGSELLESSETQRERYTLTTVSRNQERLDNIVRYLGRGVPKAEIMRTFSVGWHTLDKIAVAHGQKIADLKRRASGKLAFLVDVTVDSLIDDVLHGRVEPRDKAVLLGIGVDKLQVLTGEPTVIHGNADAAKQFSVETFRARLGQRQIIDVTPPTGSGGGNLSATREAARDQASAPDVT